MHHSVPKPSRIDSVSDSNISGSILTLTDILEKGGGSGATITTSKGSTVPIVQRGIWKKRYTARYVEENWNKLSRKKT